MKIGQSLLLDLKAGKTPMELRGKYSSATVTKYGRLFRLYKELEAKLWQIIWGSA